MRHENDNTTGRHDGDPALNVANRQAEALFASLAPALGGVDPVAAGYAAGQRAAWQSQRRQLWAWRAAASVALVGAGLSWLMPLASPGQNNLARDGSRPSPSPSGTVVVVHTPPVPTPPAASPTLPPQSVLVMRHAVSEAGLTGLSAPTLPVPKSIRNEPPF
jgi:hypothetical protein